MIIIFEENEKNFNRRELYKLVPEDTLFINHYNVSNVLTADYVFDYLQFKNPQIDNRKNKG